MRCYRAIGVSSQIVSFNSIEVHDAVTSRGKGGSTWVRDMSHKKKA